MTIDKLTDAYCYLTLKRDLGYLVMLKILWMADCSSLWKIGRTVSGSELPITELPEMEFKSCQCGLTHRKNETEYGPFGNLSLSDMQELDRAWLDFREPHEENPNLDVYQYASLEEFFMGHDHAEEMIAEIRENIAIQKELGLMFGS